MGNLNEIVANHIRQSMETKGKEAEEAALVENEEVDDRVESEEYNGVLESVMPVAISAGMGALSFRNRLRTLQK